MNRSGLLQYSLWPDTALLDAVQTGNEGAFEEVYKRYCYRLFTMAYRKLKSREVAEELVQDLFAVLWAKRTEGPIQNLEAYLFTALRYRIINYVKSQRVRDGYALYCRIAQSDATHNTEEQLAQQDLNTALKAGLDRLPEKSREVFRLSRLEHRTVPEISGRLHLSEKAIEYHITKSLKLLRGYLQDFLLVTWPLLIWITKI
ncbi:RNA polymerase sigma-70 factor [Hymenobacter sp. BT507]|uniref:RNA polymerase sigma-70 factor n=1 Tax=Hymenobacter citatus TaxID=2763506 RepID=A0ABR7MG58_9BACT|nr:RNA polymerase sigma-70 factor [Hymenobacter citatus]MBC6610057.1 RNA polymerase sigma-70 factor [Hymenobacter citatus]